MQLKMEQIESNSANNNQPYPPLRRPRTREDFYLFCKIILEYENYEMLEDIREPVSSPMDSAGSTKSESTNSSAPEGGFKSHSSASEDSDDVDSDSYYLVTCFCGKPYAKRPMIECSNCLTWLHLTCAKVKRNNIPDIFYCYKCKLSMNGESAGSVGGGVSSVVNVGGHSNGNTNNNHQPSNNSSSSNNFKKSQKRESIDSYKSSNSDTKSNLSKFEDRTLKRSSL